MFVILAVVGTSAVVICCAVIGTVYWRLCTAIGNAVDDLMYLALAPAPAPEDKDDTP